MMRIKFTRDTDALREGGDFKRGQVVDLAEASARRWINRQAAVLHVEAQRPDVKDKAEKAEVKPK